MDAFVNGAELFVSVALVIWSVATVRSAASTKGGISVRAGVAGLGIGEAFHVSWARQAVANAVGAYWESIFYHVVFMLAAMFAVDVIQVLNGRSAKVRRAYVGLGLLAVLLCALPNVFYPGSAPPGIVRDQPDVYAPGWPQALHTTVIVAYLGWAEVTFVRHCVSHARLAGRNRLGISIGFVALSGVLGLLCLIVPIAADLMWLSGHSRDIPQHAYALATGTVMGAAVACAGLGAAWQRLGALWDGWLTWTTRRSAPQRVQMLRGYWSHLIEAVPEVSPFASTLHQQSISEEHLDFQETRMATEIYDAQRLLSPLLSEHDRQWLDAQVSAAGLKHRDARATQRHLQIELGLRRRAARASAAMRPGPQPSPPASTAQIVQDVARLQHGRAQRAINDILKKDSDDRSHHAGRYQSASRGAPVS